MDEIRADTDQDQWPPWQVATGRRAIPKLLLTSNGFIGARGPHGHVVGQLRV